MITPIAGRQTLGPDPIACPEPSSTVELGPATRFFGSTPDIGCGNAGPVEITERFPPALGNLAQNARFPHSHNRLVFEEEKEEEDEEDKRKNTGEEC